MKLQDLQKSLSEMSNEELRLFMLSVRKDRRVSKAATRPKVRKEKAKKSDALETLLASMTPEQKAELLAQLGDD